MLYVQNTQKISIPFASENFPIHSIQIDAIRYFHKQVDVIPFPGVI